MRSEQLADNLEMILQKINAAELRSGRATSSAKLIAVSKKHSLDMIREAVSHGVADFGENRAAELAGKLEEIRVQPLDASVRWHMIGHLQSNKVKSLIDSVDVIHSVDRKSLAKEIQKRATESERVVDVLLQVNISDEDQKSGLAADDLEGMLVYCSSCDRLRITGLMGMASFTADESSLRKQFSLLRDLRDAHLKGGELSMGMSNDYEIAIEEGATMVRIGTALFGERQY